MKIFHVMPLMHFGILNKICQSGPSLNPQPISSVALQPRRAKTDWSGCCQMAVQGALWFTKSLSLNLNFSFLNRISLLVISNSYPVVLTRLGGPRSRPYTQGDHTSCFRRDSPVGLTCCPVLFICKSFYVLKYFNVNDKKHRYEQGY